MCRFLWVKKSVIGIMDFCFSERHKCCDAVSTWRHLNESHLTFARCIALCTLSAACSTVKNATNVAFGYFFAWAQEIIWISEATIRCAVYNAKQKKIAFWVQKENIEKSTHAKRFWLVVVEKMHEFRNNEIKACTNRLFLKVNLAIMVCRK